MILQILQLVQTGQDRPGDHDSPIGDPLIGRPVKGEGGFEVPFVFIIALGLGVPAATILLIALWPWLKGVVWSRQEERLPIGRCRVHWKCVSPRLLIPTS